MTNVLSTFVKCVVHVFRNVNQDGGQLQTTYMNNRHLNDDEHTCKLVTVNFAIVAINAG